MATTGLRPIDELIILARGGNGLAFTALWDRHIDQLRSYIKNRFKNSCRRRIKLHKININLKDSRNLSNCKVFWFSTSRICKKFFNNCLILLKVNEIRNLMNCK